ncbi:MAG TPA: NAD(P)H-binding protein [Pyrinomonadaceae bacterium]
MITVMGASGNTGRKISEALLKAGEKVRALGRSESKLASLREAGAEVLTGDLTNTDFLTEAFRGADAVYVLVPTEPHIPNYSAERDRQGESIVKAVRESGVRYVVALSSVGADLSDGTGLIAGLHSQEERLKKLTDTNILFLRPVSFFENFQQSLPLIKDQGIVVDSVAADLPVPMIATQDIADEAVKALKARDWKGVAVRELLGQRDLSHAEATRIIGESIGRPNIMYIHAPDDEVVSALEEAGLSTEFARSYVEMTRAFNEGRIQPRRTAENTTPTRFEDFAKELAVRYAAA